MKIQNVCLVHNPGSSDPNQIRTGTGCTIIYNNMFHQITFMVVADRSLSKIKSEVDQASNKEKLSGDLVFSN